VSDHLYAVRCNFTDPAREGAWNAWYGGPKMAQMLALPLMISVQRYEAMALDTRRKYLALWRVAGPETFETKEYKAQWGFAEWTNLIADWSRDLYRGEGDLDAAVDVKDGEALYFAVFEGAAAKDDVARIAAQRPSALWLEAAGLDRRASVAGVARHPAAWRPDPIDRAPAGFSEALLRPMAPRRRAKLPNGRVGG